ncbi:MAG: ATP-binding protein [Chloroflexota bacterium]
MQFLVEATAVDEMLQQNLTTDCYAREDLYPHHFYRNGEKCLVVRALYSAINDAKMRGDKLAMSHLMLHEQQVKAWAAEVERANRGLPPENHKEHPSYLQVVGKEEDQKEDKPAFFPNIPESLADLGLNENFIDEMILRIFYLKGSISGNALGVVLRVPFYNMLQLRIEDLRKQELIDISGQESLGDAGYKFTLTSKGIERAQSLMQKNAYAGAMPVPLNTVIEAIRAQTIKNVVVTHANIRRAFGDLIIHDCVLNQIGPAVNSASSIFLFGAAGNGKTSIAERITRLMGGAIFVPYAIETDGQIIKLYDTVTHEALDDASGDQVLDYDARWVRVKRPVVVVGGELTLAGLDLIYNENSKVYEAPFQMKANGGIFLIDDFGRQQCRPMDLLNRWIVPLEKRYDYLTLVTGKKLEVPFDQLIAFSSNLDPTDIADEAFLRRIKYKVNIIDPDEKQWRQIWGFVCKSKKVPYDDKALDYMVEKWYKPFSRPFRMCQPRDILEQMIALAKYSIEPPTMNPDLIDSACSTYFVDFKGKQPKTLAGEAAAKPQAASA